MEFIKKTIYSTLALFLIAGCVPRVKTYRSENSTVPATYKQNLTDTANSAKIDRRKFFTDSNLLALIDTALQNNQEYNIMLQELIVAQSEVRARKGDYLPMIGLGASGGAERPGRKTRNGAVEENLNIEPGRKFPDPLQDYAIGVNASWEVDIVKKLRNARKAAALRYLATVEGRNFMVTQLTAEIATAYYELMSLDNQLAILEENIGIQTNALAIVKLQKEAAKTTELAVIKFEAEVLKNQSRLYYIKQAITETENRINFLVGRYPQPIKRNSQAFVELVPDSMNAGIPSQLLENRPDIKQAAYQLAASKIDVKVAKANFYPSLRISANMGYQAFNTKFLLNPESMMYAATGELLAPLINRNAIKAYYYSANATQIKSVYNYEQTLLKAHLEVVNQLSCISNLQLSYNLKSKQVDALTRSIQISSSLFKSARADYMEVLMTQRDALESKFEMIETKKLQLNAVVNLYRALGGGK